MRGPVNDLCSLAKNVIMNTIKGISDKYSQGGKVHFILVLDSESTHFVSSFISMTELSSYYIALIEKYELKRQPLRSYQAIYILSPRVKINQFIQDFEGELLYSAPHLLFTYTCSPSAFDELSTHKDVVARILTFMDLYIHYQSIDRQYFIATGSNALQALYSQSFILDLSLEVTRGLISVFASWGVDPKVVYPKEDQKIQQFVDTFREQFQIVKNLMQSSTKFNSTSTILVVIPRGFDSITPLLHQFYYHSMIQENLKVENFQFKLNDKEIVYLNPFEDALFEELQFLHFQELSQRLETKRRQLLEAEQRANSQNKDRLKAFKSLAQNQAERASVANHIEIASQLSNQMKANHLVDLSTFEQNLVTKTSKGQKYKPSISDLGQNLSLINPREEGEKVRLLLLYKISNEHTKASDLDRLIKNQSFQTSEATAIDNIDKIGPGIKRNQFVTTDPSPLSTDRWIPAIVELANLISDNKLPATFNNPPEGIKNCRNVVFFIIGGVTYCELTSLYHLGKRIKDMKFYLGSTSTITPLQFIKELSQL